VLAAMMMTTGPALGATAPGVTILHAENPGPIALGNSNRTLATLPVPPGTWLITGRCGPIA
jgi:hypothetical protein